MAEAEFDDLILHTPEEQLALLQRLRPRMSTLEFVFHDGDAGHPLVEQLSGLATERVQGVGARPGYQRAEPRAVLHRYAYDRSIIAALRDLGGLFSWVSHPRGDRVEPTGLDTVDLAIYDVRGRLFFYTVTHEGLIFVRDT